jgi:hypothetical protein
VKLSRRTFIAAGALGVAALAATRFLPRTSAPGRDASLRALDADGEAIVRALVPAMLAGALPDDRASRENALDETVRTVDSAILGLPRHAQGELAELFALLASAPGRIALARTTASWSDMSEQDAHAFLERLRTSRFMLPRAAYDALHQLVFASWYGNPRTWAAIGYGGPPRLA